MPKEKVLVVDDDSAIRYMLTEALRGWGYEPFEAATVAAAMESFDAERPSAVLQDVNLSHYIAEFSAPSIVIFPTKVRPCIPGQEFLRGTSIAHEPGRRALHKHAT